MGTYGGRLLSLVLVAHSEGNKTNRLVTTLSSRHGQSVIPGELWLRSKDLVLDSLAARFCLTTFLSVAWGVGRETFVYLGRGSAGGECNG